MKNNLEIKKMLPTLFMISLLSLSVLYVYLWGDNVKIFWSGFFVILLFFAIIFFTGIGAA